MKCYRCNRKYVKRLSMCKKCKEDMFWIMGRKRKVDDIPDKTCKSSKGRRILRKYLREDEHART